MGGIFLKEEEPAAAPSIHDDDAACDGCACVWVEEGEFVCGKGMCGCVIECVVI